MRFKLKQFKNATLAFALLLCLCLAQWAVAQTGNPIANYYNGPEGYPGWTDEINWSNQINMAVYSTGANDFEKFENARDQLYAQGGGVLYYPAGTYTFDVVKGPNGRGLMLKKGVVIMGEQPATDSAAITSSNPNDIDNHGLNNLTTKFVFTDTTLYAPDKKIPYMWNMIGEIEGTNEANLGEVTHIGVAWVEFEKAYLYFGFDSHLGWAVQWDSASSWLGGTSGRLVNGWDKRKPNGTLPMDPFTGTASWGNDKALAGGKKFVFGCRFNNAMMPNYAIDKAKKVGAGYHENSNWRFGPRLAVYGSDVFVANNVIAKPTANFTYPSQLNPISVLMDYGYGLGIDVNKSLYSGMWNRCMVDDPDKSSFHSPNVVIKDNWVYNHGHKGFEFCGRWAVVTNNSNSRDFHGKSVPYPEVGVSSVVGYENHSNGKFHTGESADDNMSRAYDFGGSNVWMDNNRWGATGSAFANDGESMLIQRHNGVEAFSFAYTNNKKEPGAGGDVGYIAPYDVQVLGILQYQNYQNGSVGVHKIESNRVQDASFINNYNSWPNGSAKTAPDAATTMTDHPSVKDWLDTCATNPTLNAPINVTISANTAEKYVTINWEDNTTGEVGYRVERRRPGTTDWTVIAYRPRVESDTTFNYPGNITNDYGPNPISQCFNKNINFNPPKWVDYLATSNLNWEYRVVGFNCASDEVSATVPTGVTAIEAYYSVPVNVVTLNMYPNPAKSQLNIDLLGAENSIGVVKLFDLSGKLLAEKATPNSGATLTFNVDGLESGMYLIQYTDDKGNQTTDKFVKD